MENGGKKIKKIKLYNCGFCVNHLKHVLQKEKDKKVIFPALCVYIEHKEYGNILFDTGYSDKIYKNGIISLLYNCVNKTFVKEEEFIVNRLKNDGINKIETIILSHLHPDHIGGLNDFVDYNLIVSKETNRMLLNSEYKDLVFKNMLPKVNHKVVVLNKECTHEFLNKYFDKVYDIFGDESIFAVTLPGHAKGQIGIFIPEYNLLLAADSSWGNYFSDNVERMKKIPQRIQNDFEEYKNTIYKLKKLKAEYPTIEIIYSHEKNEEREYD